MPFILKTKISETASLGIWQITEPEEDLRGSVTLLAADEARLAGIRHPLRRRQWLACRAIAAGLTGNREVFLDHNDKGAPLFAGNKLNVSFSHTGGYAAAMISSSAPVGIDIELLKDRILRVADRFMTKEEAARAAEPNLLEKLYVHWTVKEALFKLHRGAHPDIHQGIVLEPFDYLCSGSGVVSACVITGESRISHRLGWITTREWMLAYTLE